MAIATQMATTTIRAKDYGAADRIHIEDEERAEGAQDESHNHAESKGKARRDDTQTILGALHREPVEAAPSPFRNLPEQPLSAKAESPKEGEIEKNLGFGR